MNGIAGSTSRSPSNRTTAVSPSARPPSPISTCGGVNRTPRQARGAPAGPSPPAGAVQHLRGRFLEHEAPPAPARASEGQRVHDQAEPAEQQHLRGGLAERGPARVQLGKREPEHERPGRGPPRPGQPPDQAAERQHREPAEYRAHRRGGRGPVHPERPGQQ